MTINLALEYIPRRMEELGFGNNYFLRFRHLILKGGELLEIPAYNQFFILVEEAVDVSVESELGIFNPATQTANEMLYEHTGRMKIQNYAPGPNHIRFIQVIPKNKVKANGKDNQ